jgi:hypothetical protein
MPESMGMAWLSADLGGALQVILEAFEAATAGADVSVAMEQ